MSLFNVWVQGNSSKEWIVKAVNESDAKAKIYNNGSASRDRPLGAEELNFEQTHIYSINAGRMV